MVSQSLFSYADLRSFLSASKFQKLNYKNSLSNALSKQRRSCLVQIKSDYYRLGYMGWYHFIQQTHNVQSFRVFDQILETWQYSRLRFLICLQVRFRYVFHQFHYEDYGLSSSKSQLLQTWFRYNRRVIDDVCLLCCFPTIDLGNPSFSAVSSSQKIMV